MKNLIYDQYRKLIRESKFRWLIIVGSALYILSPFDISPDFLPIVGWIDDGLVLTVLLTEVSAILMEKIKEKKAATDSSSSSGSSASNNAAQDADTVDVDSVQVK
jgi:uncharacterized membrane protein YkvA (DUF1232 family)